MHPNRGLISERYLGGGNEFVLGSMGVPEHVLILDHCHHLLEMWFWFGALVGYVAREELRQRDASFSKDYLVTAAQAETIAKWLVENFNRILELRQAEMKGEHPS
jgi:hypothetical protein